MVLPISGRDSSDVPADVLEDPIKLLEWLSGQDDTNSFVSNLFIEPEPSSGSSGSSSALPEEYELEPRLCSSDEQIDVLVEIRPALRSRLARAGYSTVGQLASATKSRILSIPGFGVGKAAEVESALRRYASDVGTRPERVFVSASKKVHKAAAQNDVFSDSWEIRELKAAGVPFNDFRRKGGTLKIIGGSELSPLIRKLEAKGLSFRFVANGSSSTSYKPYWWTRDLSPRAFAPAKKQKPSVRYESEAGQLPVAAIASLSSCITVAGSKGQSLDISISDVVIARKYGPSTLVNTNQESFICRRAFEDFAPLVEMGSFVEVGNIEILNKAAVASIEESPEGGYVIGLHGTSAVIKVAGKNADWVTKNFSDTLGSAPHVGAVASSEASEVVFDEGSPLAVPELVGILFGITCDGVVNETEARMLKRWLEGVETKNDSRIEAIINLLEKVLEDDVVTTEEEAEMLSLFNRIIDLGKAFSLR